MDPLLIIALSVLNFVVAFFGVSVGGSGLVMTPALISAGIPAPSAVATKRFSNLGIASFGMIKFQRKGKVLWRIGIPLMAVSSIAAFVAANIVLTLNEMALQRIIGIVIIAVLVFMIANRRLGIEERAKRMRKRNKALGVLAFFFAVFVANFSGAGGILTSYVLILFFGLTFLQSAGTRKVSAIASLLVSLAVYIHAGVIPFELAIPMFIAASLGGFLGSHYAIKKGDLWVRRLFMVVVVILAIRLLVF